MKPRSPEVAGALLRQSGEGFGGSGPILSRASESRLTLRLITLETDGVQNRWTTTPYRWLELVPGFQFRTMRGRTSSGLCKEINSRPSGAESNVVFPQSSR